jgi:hypothetical protein
MSITLCPPLLASGEVQTWVKSQWKIPTNPCQVSAEINILEIFSGWRWPDVTGSDAGIPENVLSDIRAGLEGRIGGPS